MVERAGDYRGSSFGFHGRGEATGYSIRWCRDHAAHGARLWRPIRRFGIGVGRSTYKHMPEEAELAAIRRSNETGFPNGEPSWVGRHCGKLKLDLTIRPRW